MADLPHVRTNLGDVRRHTLRVAEEITQRWTLFYVWGIGGRGHHAAGRALDFMTLTADQSRWRTRVGHEIAAYLRRHHRRLGVQYIIYRRRIWNATRADDRSRVEHHEWRWMEDRGNPTDNHMDHVHLSLRNNPPPYRAPDGSAPPSGGTDDGLLERGDHNPRVRRLQELLNEHGYSLLVDGAYGPKTEAAVRAYQRANGLAVDGVAGPVTLGHLQEDDVSAQDVWEHEIKVPWGTKDNPEWQARSLLINANQRIRSVQAQLTAQAVTIDKLVDAVGAAQGFDPAVLKREIREAIESVTVRLDVGEET